MPKRPIKGHHSRMGSDHFVDRTERQHRDLVDQFLLEELPTTPASSASPPGLLARSASKSNLTRRKRNTKTDARISSALDIATGKEHSGREHYAEVRGMGTILKCNRSRLNGAWYPSSVLDRCGVHRLANICSMTDRSAQRMKENQWEN